jgi:hypothetical protein
MSAQPATQPGDTIGRAAEALAAFGRLKLRLTGTSMLPALQPGDEVEFRSISGCQAKPGDIVLFRGEAGLVSHRVLACTGRGLVTQGDSLREPDRPVAHADVLALGVSLTRRTRPLDWKKACATPRPLTRWWFRRFDLATRAWLRWHRFAIRRST